MPKHCYQSMLLWHGLRTPREEIAFTAQPKIHSHSQIFRYSQSIFCLPHRHNFSDIFDWCLHWVSVVRAFTNPNVHVVNCTNIYLPVIAGLIKNVIQTYSQKHFEIEKQCPKIYFPLMTSNEWIHANLLLIHTIAY